MNCLVSSHLSLKNFIKRAFIFRQVFLTKLMTWFLIKFLPVWIRALIFSLPLFNTLFAARRAAESAWRAAFMARSRACLALAIASRAALAAKAAAWRTMSATF